MRIRDESSSFVIDIAPMPEISRYSFAVTASIDNRVVSMDSLATLDYDSFLDDLQNLVAGVGKEACLRATYDFLLRFSSAGPQPADVDVSFYVAEYLRMPHRGVGDFGRLALSGAFTIDPDVVAHLWTEFSEMFPPDSTPN